MSRKLRHGGKAQRKKGKVGKKDEKPGLAETQTLEEKLSRPVSSLKLGRLYAPIVTRTINALEANGIRTLGDLVKLSEDDLGQMKYLRGDKTIKAIRVYLARLGLSLAESEPEKKERFGNLKKPVQELDFSIRTVSLLFNAKIEYVFELVQTSEVNLLKLLKSGQLGRKSLREVKEVLATMGLSLGMDLKELGFEKPQNILSLEQKKKEDLKKSVDELGFSVRAENCLYELDIKHVFELVQATEADLLKVKNFGRKTLREVKEVLATMGLSLGMDLKELGFEKQKTTPGPEKFDALKKGKDAPEVEKKVTMRQALVLDIGLSLDQFQGLVEDAKGELEGLLKTVRPEVAEKIKQVLELFRFPPPEKGFPMDLDGSGRARSKNTGVSP